jgi:hypothetical protein
MHSMMRKAWLAATGVMILVGCANAQAPQPSAKDMTFFVTSTGPGK